MSVRDVIAGRGGKSSSKQVRVQQLRDAARPCAGALLRAAGTLDPLEQRMMLSANDVIINEIMYNSATFETADEYVELYNKGTTPVSLNGWKLAKGVDYTFGNTTINAGAYLVVAADLSRFASKYPGVSNVVGPWVGQLANSSDSIRLEDNLGRQVDQIDYADDGEWAARRRGGEAPKAVTGITASGTTATVTAPGHGYANGNQVAIFGANQAGFDGIFTIANVSGNTFTVTVPAGTPATATGQIYVRRADHNHFGWDWFNPSDGMGKSLELVNANLPNNNGENWGPSIPDNGTPGAANSIAATNSAPLINDLQHFPLVPKSTEQVTVTATVTDELKTGLSVQAFYRNDGAASFNSIAMFDDGLHGDGSANDGVYGARLPAQPNNTIVEFYVKATDSTAHSRTWPGPTDVTGVQGANALYQVDDRSYSSTNPLFKIIMSADEANELAVLRGSSDDLSNAAFNATFISSDGTGSDLRYLVGVRNRGGGSRSSGAPVANYHINFGDFNTWHNKVKINLNAIYSADEVVASALASRAGVPAQWVTDVQVRVNNVDLSTNGANVKMFGLYSYVEDEDKQMVENHFPTDDQGNYYRGIDGGHNAGLQFVDNNPASYQVKYPKQTNVEANDYTDLINLTKALDPNQTPDASFAAAINAQIDVKEWMRYFAFNVLVGNGETALGTGYGDDYALYRGVIDPKFKLVAHDLDTVLGFGDTNVAQNRSIFVATNVATIKRLLQFPDFAPIYFQTLREMIDTVWNPTELGRVIHHAMDDIAGKATADTLVADALARAQAALAQIPQTLAVTGTPTKVNGYAQVTNTAALTLSGSANALVSNARILVNGRAASYTPYQGAWSITNTGNTLGLVGGLNRVLVQEMDGGNKEVARTFVDVWYSVPAGTSVSGAITGSTVWSPANGPYRVTANVTVNAGATLTIQPGTSVYFANGTRLTVNGLLNAVGTDTQRIRFTHDPALNSTAATWGGIYFANTTQANRIAYADIEFAGVGGPDTQIASSKADLDHDTWATPGSGQRIIDVTGSSSFSITNSIVGSLVGEEPIHFLGSVFAGGQALIRGNVIGTTTGHNDIIDFTGTNRPAAIFQILDNVFIGTGTGGTVADDILDVDGTDAHIEGNVFMNVQPSGINDTNSAISGGADSGNTSEIVSSRNFFYNVDHAFLMKEGNSVRSINDTIEHVLTGVFNFDEPGFAASPGAGGYADGDVFYDIPSSNGTPKIVQNPPTGVFDVRHSITNAGPMAGIGNLNADPELVNPDGPGPANARVDPALIYTAMTMSPEFRTALARFAPTSGATADMSLKPTSPAIGAGPNGSDMGADVPAGATIGGAPASPTPNNSATITVGGAGIFAYQYKLDSGAWSAAVNVTNPLTNSPVIPPIVLSGLANGQHTISVVYQNDAGAWQSQSTPTTKTWTVNTAIQGRVRINEILADNQTAVNNAGTHPDVIELYNDGKATLDLSGYSISDDAANPRRFVFPAGTSIGAGQYLLLYADDPSAAPGIHLGFALSSTNGEGVFLYDAASTLVDSITFGSQLPDLSIGRVGDGTTWALTTPTLGSANVAMPTGDPDKLKINEWLASGVPPFSADFIELYNPSPLPVDVGGMYVTDKLNGWPTQDHLAPLSFVPASGFMKLTADGDTNAGANHLNFQLDHDRGEIALFNAQQTLVDSLFYAAQSSGVSEGLSPDGSANYVFFNQPSPGLSNPGTQNQETTINVVKLGDSWKFNQTDLFNDSSWAQSGFNDGTANWQPGATVIYHEDSALPWAKNTEIADATHPYSNTRRVYYFRKTFNIADPSQIKSLTLNVLIDDGAVFYVNGQEIPGTRYNMPGGAVNSTTLASASIGNASSIETYSIPVSMLVAGNNVLAIEVHQNFGTGTTSTDVVMGATLDAVQQADNTPPPPLRVTELMYNPPGSPNVNGDENEFIELQNVGASPLNITGYRFNGGVQFTFPNLTLAPGQKTLIVKDLAAFTARYGNSLPVAGEYLDSLDNNGELIRLETNAGQLVQQFTYSDAWYPSTDGNGDSLVINNPSADPSTWSNASSWHASTATLGTPGIDETTSPPQHAVVVNEVLANSPTGPNDWIELKNTTGAAINISGWYLSDSGDNLLKYRIPDGTILPANGFLTFDEQRTFGSIANGANAFSLSSTGDDVYISSSATAGVLGAYRDAAHFGASDPNVTLGRYQTSTGRVDFVALTKATKGADNAGPLVGPVVINELMYHPDGSGDEYIELRNITSSTVPLYDPANPNDTWKLTDGVDFTFPTGLSLAPGEIMLVIPESISVADFRAKYGIPASVQVVGGYIGVLSNSGEHVELAKPGAPQPDLTVPYIKVDDVEYGTGGTWPASPDGDGPSLVRFVDTHYGNDVANWRASVQLGGTPGQPNDVSPLTAAGSFVEVAANRLVFLFSKNVVGGISTADLQLTNLTTGAPVPQSAMSVTYDAAANIATFTFPGLANGQLAAGRYRAVLLSNGVASGGQALDGNGDGNPGDDYVFDFVHLPGDLNGDAKVDFADYQAFELNYGKTSGATWADGDWNYDGAVNDADTAILFANLGTVLAPAPALPAQSPTPAPVPSKPAPAPTPKPAPKPVTKKTTKPVAKPTATRQATTTNPTNPFSATKIVKTKATTGAVWA